MNKLCMLLAVVSVAACSGGGSGPAPGPAVTSFNGATGTGPVQVGVQIWSGYDPQEAHANTQARASRVCAKRGQSARYQSRRMVGNANWEDIYMCG